MITEKETDFEQFLPTKTTINMKAQTRRICSLMMGLKRLMALLCKVDTLHHSTSLCQVTVSLNIVKNSH